MMRKYQIEFCTTSFDDGFGDLDLGSDDVERNERTRKRKVLSSERHPFRQRFNLAKVNVDSVEPVNLKRSPCRNDARGV
jgi:hypothetical protein